MFLTTPNLSAIVGKAMENKPRTGQRIGDKGRRKCESVLGRPVVFATANRPDTPHCIVVAVTGPKEAFLVNMRKRIWIPYIVDGKFEVKRYRHGMICGRKKTLYEKYLDSLAKQTVNSPAFKELGPMQKAIMEGAVKRENINWGEST